MTKQENRPKHVAIIMDGNGRWAKQKGMSRIKGHQEGLLRAKEAVAYMSELSIPYLSLFVFSTENWKRSVDEVGFLMNLAFENLPKEIPFYRQHNIRVCYSGCFDQLPKKVQKVLTQVIQTTKEHTGLSVNLAINYGGQSEIIRAFQRWQQDHSSSELEPEQLWAYLDCPDFPGIDLLIRTGNEQRMSNFMLWQASYAELYFSDCLWPVWDKIHMDKALQWYGQRNRRFGGL